MYPGYEDQWAHVLYRDCIQNGAHVLFTYTHMKCLAWLGESLQSNESVSNLYTKRLI